MKYSHYAEALEKKKMENRAIGDKIVHCKRK